MASRASARLARETTVSSGRATLQSLRGEQSRKGLLALSSDLDLGRTPSRPRPRPQKGNLGDRRGRSRPPSCPWGRPVRCGRHDKAQPGRTDSLQQWPGLGEAGQQAAQLVAADVDGAIHGVIRRSAGRRCEGAAALDRRAAGRVWSKFAARTEGLHRGSAAKGSGGPGFS